ncbi:MAG TPA: 3-ketoacyl-ACP reductase [Tepidisphaeraceae bacterium]|jgi:NAD(P)-dependent dehydrogenase (short-subunit alcohol dehydrogenase family)|nr:3-ketoacyl-ACP reductase [Tepidisphaeraceae bacterium]
MSKTALITGGSRGIGRGIALELATSGFDCAISYVSNDSAADKTKSEIQSLGRRTVAIKADIAVEGDRQKLLDETTSALGDVHLLVNNAGVAPTQRTDILEATEESFDRLMDTNLKGPYFLTQRVARHMIERKIAGKIVNITSVSAYTASTNRGDYCISKAGLSMTTKLFAARLAEHGINVYEIRPGIIETDMTGPLKDKYDKLIFESELTPIHRWGQPQDVARAVVAVAMDLLPFSTGQVIDVDGGFHLRRL